jgi:hypothetical protein
MENKYINLKRVLDDYLNTPRKNGIPSKIISDPDKDYQEKVYTIQKTVSKNGKKPN